MHGHAGITGTTRSFMNQRRRPRGRRRGRPNFFGVSYEMKKEVNLVAAKASVRTNIHLHCARLIPDSCEMLSFRSRAIVLLAPELALKIRSHQGRAFGFLMLSFIAVPPRKGLLARKITFALCRLRGSHDIDVHGAQLPRDQSRAKGFTLCGVQQIVLACVLPIEPAHIVLQS